MQCDVKFQRAKTNVHLLSSLFNVNNRNPVGGLVNFQGVSFGALGSLDAP